MQRSHAVSASVPHVSLSKLSYSFFSSKRCDVGWSRMFSALAVAARPRRETEECYAVMLLNFAQRNLFVNYILHASRDRILHCDWTALHSASGGRNGNMACSQTTSLLWNGVWLTRLSWGVWAQSLGFVQ